MYWLPENQIAFPSPHLANKDGIVGIGGDLSLKRLVLAYRMGIFPWYNEGEPIIWWSPNPRFVLYPENLKVSKSTRKVLRDKAFEITFDTAFRQVITSCQNIPRMGQDGTWITPEMLEAYCDLHEKGIAHSVEVWQNKQLVGGLYGISLGQAFFGESMFSKVSNASKVGFITLVRTLQQYDFDMIDCQTHTNYLESLGGEDISRIAFTDYLQINNQRETLQGNWGELLERFEVVR